MFRNDHELLKMETHVLKVHINCEGCKQKVRKLLKKIEGVYSVNIDVEHQVVIVSGCVDSATIIKKLVRSRKHAELLSPSFKHTPNQDQASTNDIFLANELNSPKNYLLPASLSDEIENLMNFEDYLDQRNMMSAINEATYHDLEEIRRMENVYMNRNNSAGIDRLEDNMASVVGLAQYQGNDTGGRRYEQNHLPYFMNNKQQRYQYNFPFTEMNNSYMQDTQIINNEINGIQMQQPHMINHATSMYPSYLDYNLHAIPWSYK